jgi:hypothetical protein
MAAENENKLDYGAILADLEAKKSVLEQAITSLRAAIAIGTLGSSDGATYVNFSSPSASGSIHGGEVPAGAFFGKSIPEAAKLYLSIIKKKQTTKEISDALKGGGMETTSDNWEGIVGAGLNRAMKKVGEFVKVGRAWALAEWYPAGIRSSVTQEKPNKRKAKKQRPQKTSDGASKTTDAQDQKNGHKNVQSRIAEFLQHHSGSEYSPKEICDELDIDGRGIYFVLKSLVSKKVAEEVSGKYRALQSVN